MSPGVISSPRPVRAESPAAMPQNGPGRRGKSRNMSNASGSACSSSTAARCSTFRPESPAEPAWTRISAAVANTVTASR